MRFFTTRKYRDLGILLVEDHADARESMPDLLGMVGYRNIWTAEDGAKALEIICSNPESISVILLDIGLPDMSGLALFRCLMQEHQVPVAVVALTGYGMRGDKRNFFELGNEVVLAFKYLTKPVNFTALRRVLRGALRTVCELRRQQTNCGPH
jgi:two-component system, OmpR family, KDP operon response regulator KdpE